MSDMDTVCKQRFDNKLSLMIENKQNNPWKEVWKNKEENIANEKCPSDNGKSNDTDEINSRHVGSTPVDVATSSSNNSETEVIESSENTSDDCGAKQKTEEIPSDCPFNAIEIDESPDEVCSSDAIIENDIFIDTVINPTFTINDESKTTSPNQSQSDNSVKVCDISSCSYFGKPDPLISIEKVDHDSSFESIYETGTSMKQDGQSDIVLESDQNMNDDSDDDDDVAETAHDISDIEVEYDKGERNVSNLRFVHENKNNKFKSHSRKTESCDVVQISSSEDEDDDDEDMDDHDDDHDDDDDDDDEDSVHSLFAASKEESVKRVAPPPTLDHVCSMITMDIMELNISAMKVGPISCFPNHGCIFFKYANNNIPTEVPREMVVHAHSLESHQWVPMFGGLVLEVTLNMTGYHGDLMTFFQVPQVKIARCYLRFPLVLLRIYFEARLIALSLKHNFHQFLNSNLLGRNPTWHTNKNQQMTPYSQDYFQSSHDSRDSIRPSKRTRRRARPYTMRILRSTRVSSKFSYYRPPRWPYIKKVEHFDKRGDEYFKENGNGFCFESRSSSNWTSQASSQNYYQSTQGYYRQPYVGGRDFVGPSSSSMVLDAYGHQIQQNMAIVPASHHYHHHQQQLQGRQWFNNGIPQQQSPLYITSGFQGITTKLFTYKPPNSKGGINITNEDLFCLNDGEYLNDVIIDFYLKYLMEEVASPGDRQRTHVFSSFFYGHLMSGNSQDAASSLLSPEEQRHAKVKTWTRHVDIFSKDFIIVPINESYHWFLAVICFPNVQGISKCRQYQEQTSIQNVQSHDNLPASETTSDQSPEDPTNGADQIDQSRVTKMDPFQSLADSSSSETSRVEGNEEKKSEDAEECMDTLPDQSCIKSPSVGVASNSQTSLDNEVSTAKDVTPESQISQDSQILNDEDACGTTSKEVMKDDNNDEDREMDESEDDIMMDVNSECGDNNNIIINPLSSSSSSLLLSCQVKNTLEASAMSVSGLDAHEEINNDDSKEVKNDNDDDDKVDALNEEDNNPTNPCILIFDSLKGESRYDVANILRQYLQVEWNLRKRSTEGERSFVNSMMKGSMVSCPQQPNSSDCGIYVLQFVESFFKDPIKDFTLPVSLLDWFTSKVAMSKRFQLAKLIMKLKDDLNPNLEYDPNNDGCFNIAPILSDDEDDDEVSKDDDDKLDCKDQSIEMSNNDKDDASNGDECKDDDKNIDKVEGSTSNPRSKEQTPETNKMSDDVDTTSHEAERQESN